MRHSNQPIIKYEVGLIKLTEELNNVSKACKFREVSQATCYRYQEWVEEGGVEALVNRSRSKGSQSNPLNWSERDELIK